MRREAYGEVAGCVRGNLSWDDSKNDVGGCAEFELTAGSDGVGVALAPTSVAAHLAKFLNPCATLVSSASYFRTLTKLEISGYTRTSILLCGSVTAIQSLLCAAANKVDPAAVVVLLPEPPTLGPSSLCTRRCTKGLNTLPDCAALSCGKFVPPIPPPFHCVLGTIGAPEGQVVDPNSSRFACEFANRLASLACNLAPKQSQSCSRPFLNPR